ncbi:hypothetical protein L6452_42214 [Arctium lappa]|uniref:Uncharacterized protein n=1 Tax=Arctium lappa TaxID=4217 RepID=A0ACB8XI20_ARCLA|nr:hypothetical protein L6452_42214 [Arctium lappa]
MCMASDPSTKTKDTDAFKQASKLGMNVVRTRAFSDGCSKPLQTSPGCYNEDMFKGLDFVISEAKQNGLHLILSLVNNWDDFGGKKQYVQWARDHGGQYLNSDDEFFSNVVVKGYYKNHVKEWIVEMAAEIKSIDKNHLLEIGLEGFYGESMPDKKQSNPGYEVGTDFISNNQINNVDFATIHIYPDQWVPGSDEARAEFVEKWINSHIEDCKSILGKPLLIAEFGKSSSSAGYTVEACQDRILNKN